MPPDDDSLQRIEALERKVARLEQDLDAGLMSARRASVQQALMDERLVALERNRLFRWWNQLYRAAADLYARIGSDDRYGGLADLRPPGDYLRWVNREEDEMEREDHCAAMARWASQPLISVVVTSGEGAGDSARSVVGQCYANWELCLPESLQRDFATGSRTRIVRDRSEATGDYLLVLHAGDRLSPHALYFYAQALAEDPAAIVYCDEDCIRDGVPGDPIFKPGWWPELLRSTMYLGRGVLYPRATGFRLPPSPSRARHIARVLYHRAASTPLEHTATACTAPPDARVALIICSRDVRRLRECLKAVRATAAVPQELLVVHHQESGSGDRMQRLVDQFGGTLVSPSRSFRFCAHE